MDEATQKTRTELTSVHAARSGSAYVIALCCVAAIGGFLFGFDSGAINGTVDVLAKALALSFPNTGTAQECGDGLACVLRRSWSVRPQNGHRASCGR